MKTYIIAALALATMTATARAEECNTQAIILDGIFSRGSMVCTDGKWLDRRASLLVLELAKKDCSIIDEKTASGYLDRGMRDFDNKVTEIGKPAACKMLDHIMTKVEEMAGNQ
jgi:hypothetical protein